MSGIKTKNLPLTTAVSELIGHDRQDSTARIRLSSLSTLIGHEVAGDIAASGGIGVFDTVGAGSDAVSNGAFFAVKGSGDIYLSLYQKVSGSAQKVGDLPSLEAVSTLIGSATLATNWDAIDRSGFYRGGSFLRRHHRCAGRRYWTDAPAPCGGNSGQGDAGRVP